MRRRDFLLTTGVALAGWRIPTRIQPIGLQLYTARTLMARDMEGTLAAVARIGYREVEFAGYFNRTPEQVRALLTGVGLSAPAAHVDFASLERGWDETLETAQAVGHRYVVVPWIPQDRRTLDGYRRVAQLFEQRGADARAAGLVFAYHNHDFEFADVSGTTGYDILCEETSAANVRMEMDLFWTVKGGRDPHAYFARYPGRFPLVHVKDMDADGRMVDPGQGQMDFAAIVAARETAGIRHWFVEHDDPTDVMETLRRGHGLLQSLET
ncbi:MAG: sugar phosphate isomerase/epimerase [Gemmatimonadales bacterium]